MNVIGIILVLFFLVRLIDNYRSTIILVSAWILVMRMIGYPMLNGLTLYSIVSMAALLIGLIKKAHIYESVRTFPFAWAIVGVIISLCFTNLYSGQAHWPSAFVSSISEYIFPIIVFCCIQKKKDIEYFLKCSLAFTIPLIFYTLFEAAIGSNPVISCLEGSPFFQSVDYQEEFRFGIKRCQSFMPLNGALGMACCIFFLFYSYLYVCHRKYIKYCRRNFKCILYLLLLCALLTGTRSVIAGMVVALLYNVVSVRHFKVKTILHIMIPLLVIILFFGRYFANILGTFLDTEAVGGSSSDMRSEQLATSFFFMNQNFWFGNGIGYTFSYVAEYYKDLIRGAESVWFSLMIDQGAIGVLTYLIAILTPIYYGYRNRCLVISFITLTYIVIKSLTSAPGIGEGYYWIFIAIILKIEWLEKDIRFHENASCWQRDEIK